jgi:hypothetical protein
MQDPGPVSALGQPLRWMAADPAVSAPLVLQPLDSVEGNQALLW